MVICPKHSVPATTEAEQALAALAKLFQLKTTEQPPPASHRSPAGVPNKPLRRREDRVDAEIYQHL